MRRLLLSAALLAAGLTASAQKITFIPTSISAFLQGEVISNDGKYLGGSDTAGQAFIYDTTTGEIKFFASPNLDQETTDINNAALYSINNDGVAVGYLERKATEFNYATGKYETLLNESSIAKYMANDGTIFGITYNDAYDRTPFMMKDGVKTDLPMATEEWAGYENSGFDINNANADGSIIVGFGQDNFDSYPMTIWAKNKDNKTYSIVPASKKYLDTTDDFSGHQPYDWFEGAAISSNGKWIAAMLHGKDDYEHGLSIVRYHVDTDSIEVINCPETDNNYYYYANSVADDGTIIGYAENQMSYGRFAIICKGGENEAKRMSEVFPELTEIATMDGYDNNTPCMITPDGRYITGFGYIDFDDSNLCFGTYVIDTQDNTDGVESIKDNGNSNSVKATYTVDGKVAKRFDGSRKSIVINKMTNGQTKKVLK